MKRRHAGHVPHSAEARAIERAAGITAALAQVRPAYQPPRRCATRPSVVGLQGECLFCGADNAEHCRAPKDTDQQ